MKLNTVSYMMLPMKHGISIRNIIETVSAEYGVSYAVIQSPLRDRQVASARMTVMILIYYNNENSITEKYMSLSEMAKAVERDHSTLIYYLKTFVSWYKYDKDYKVKFIRTCNNLGLSSEDVARYIIKSQIRPPLERRQKTKL